MEDVTALSINNLILFIRVQSQRVHGRKHRFMTDEVIRTDGRWIFKRKNHFFWAITEFNLSPCKGLYLEGFIGCLLVRLCPFILFGQETVALGKIRHLKWDSYKAQNNNGRFKDCYRTFKESMRICVTLCLGESSSGVKIHLSPPLMRECSVFSLVRWTRRPTDLGFPDCWTLFFWSTCQRSIL